jgi:hypothetical protein
MNAVNPLTIFYILGIIAIVVFFIWLKGQEKKGI